MSFGRKFKRTSRNTPAETAYRMQGEAECRKIADVIATMIPASELQDKWRQEGSAHVTEPSAETASFIRETVQGMRDVPLDEILLGMTESVASLKQSLAAPAQTLTSDSPLAIAGKLVVEAMAIFDREMHSAMRLPEETEGVA